MRLLLERFEQFWCKHMHADIMWPSQGAYQCKTCLRRYPVEFDQRVKRPTLRAA
jgi:hypothetical protein